MSQLTEQLESELEEYNELVKTQQQVQQQATQIEQERLQRFGRLTLLQEQVQAEQAAADAETESAEGVTDEAEDPA